MSARMGALKLCFLVVLTLGVISSRASAEDIDETTDFLLQMESLPYFSNFTKLLKVAGEHIVSRAVALNVLVLLNYY